MVCYGPRIGTIAIAGAAAYVLLHKAAGRILHIAGLIMQIALITCAAARRERAPRAASAASNR